MPRKVNRDTIVAIRKAVRANCIDCMGTRANAGWSKMIENCSSRVCHLWPYRFGVSTVIAKKRKKDVQP